MNIVMLFEQLKQHAYIQGLPIYVNISLSIFYSENVKEKNRQDIGLTHQHRQNLTSPIAAMSWPQAQATDSGNSFLLFTIKLKIEYSKIVWAESQTVFLYSGQN